MIIPSDLVNPNRLRLPTNTAIQQVAPSQAVTDLLAELVPGQRIMAEIQAALPNGTYRALVNQREVTLALPFSAKSGDSLEMEVVDNNGRMALAVMARGPEQAATRGSAATSLSRAGQLIATLLTAAPTSPKERATPLNGNQPLLTNPRITPEEMAPLLKQAVSSSGLFYEAHQARWTMGQFNLGELLKEPQAQASPALPMPSPPPGQRPEAASRTAPSPPQPAPPQPQAPGAGALPTANPALPPTGTTASAAAQAPPLAAAGPDNIPATPAPLAADLAPLVRQQLESMASNTYIWQGQIWPGQEMRWELVEEDGHNDAQADDGEPASTWKTRLHLELPKLGIVDARIGLQGDQLNLHLLAATPDTREQLRNHGAQLAGQMEAAGLKLGGFMVDRNGPADA